MVIVVREITCRGGYTGEEICYNVWWFSPLLFLLFVSFGLCFIDVGEIHRRGDLKCYSRSPLSEPESSFGLHLAVFITVGEIHRSEYNCYNSRSPLYETEIVFFL